MKININEITKQLGLSRDFEYYGPFSIREIDVDLLVDFKAHLTHTGKGIILEGTIDTSIDLECARCLEIFSLPVHIDVFEEFMEKDRNIPTDEKEPDSGDVYYYYGDDIDVKDAIRQNILASLPMNPICSEDCRGICPQCGGNLNLEPCSCGAGFNLKEE
ncbi:MAG: DUF177 domain-containing protein [Chloroflexi bacterium]|nr:DUF177 domain-containing protein [Chloroflexota bacterium]